MIEPALNKRAGFQEDRVYMYDNEKTKCDTVRNGENTHKYGTDTKTMGVHDTKDVRPYTERNRTSSHNRRLPVIVLAETSGKIQQFEQLQTNAIKKLLGELQGYFDPYSTDIMLITFGNNTKITIPLGQLSVERNIVPNLELTFEGDPALGIALNSVAHYIDWCTEYYYRANDIEYRTPLLFVIASGNSMITEGTFCIDNAKMTRTAASELRRRVEENKLKAFCFQTGIFDDYDIFFNITGRKAERLLNMHMDCPEIDKALNEIAEWYK